MKYSVFLGMAFFVSLQSQAQFNRLDSVSVNTLEQFILNEKASEKMVGVSVGMIRNGEVAYLKGFGYEDSLANIAATESTMYRLASVSKSVTGLIAMRLIEKAQLDLNKDIRDYVPEYPAKAFGVITSEDLLSNESGVIHYSGSGNCTEPYNVTYRNSYIASHTNSYDPIAAIGIFKDQKTCFVPGSQYQYTTWGFCLMGAVLQRAASKSFDSLLQDEIVCPLNLPSLQIEYQSKKPYPHQAEGYRISGGQVALADTNSTDYKDISYKVPGGGMISSVIDLTLLMQGLVNRKLLADSTLKLFGTRHTPTNGTPSYYGYGTSTNFRNGDTLFWHSGSQEKTATLIYYSPENKNGVVIMSNTKGAGLFPLARLIYDYLPNSTLQGTKYPTPTTPSPCSGIGLPEPKDLSLLKVTPNPSNGTFRLETEQSLKNVNLSIYDNTGKQIYHEFYNHFDSLRLTLKLTQGIYTIDLQTQDGFNQTEKLVIQ